MSREFGRVGVRAPTLPKTHLSVRVREMKKKSYSVVEGGEMGERVTSKVAKVPVTFVAGASKSSTGSNQGAEQMSKVEKTLVTEVEVAKEKKPELTQQQKRTLVLGLDKFLVDNPGEHQYVAARYVEHLILKVGMSKVWWEDVVDGWYLLGGCPNRRPNTFEAWTASGNRDWVVWVVRHSYALITERMTWTQEHVKHVIGLMTFEVGTGLVKPVVPKSKRG